MDTGGPVQTIGLSGSTIPFPASLRDRQESGDPRPSIEERYPSKENYLEIVREAACVLVEEGYLLRGRDILSVELLPAGKSNTNYKLILSDGNQYVLRLYGRGNPARETYVAFSYGVPPGTGSVLATGAS